MPVLIDFDEIKNDPWLLNPTITYLNHGSFGARVQSIFDFQVALKREFESSPVDFLDRNRGKVDDARRLISSFLGADPEGFGFVDNATTGVASVVHSIHFSPGDEILTTNHVYNGVRQVLTKKAVESNCSYREIPITLPISDGAEILQILKDSISNETKLLVIDHVSSPSAIVFPVEEIAYVCREKGILCLVDGAHAAGMLALSIGDVGCDWYVGNLHKWVCAPVSVGFVWTSIHHRSTTHPLTVSHWLNQGYKEEFDWQGTKDITTWLTAAKAVQWGKNIGWDIIQEHNHRLVVQMHEALTEAWKVEPLTPLDGSMLGSMATVFLPKGCPTTLDDCLELRDALYVNHRIEVPVFEFQSRGALRVSAQLYSALDDISDLKTAINSVSVNNI